MITLFTISLSSVFFVLVVSSLSSNFYVAPSRFSVVRSLLFGGVLSIFSGLNSSFSYLLASLILFLLVVNVSGNIPLINIGSMYYFITCSISISMWVGLIVVVCRSQLYGFISHILPYGSPVALSLFLPLVEIFSQLIRPLTLMIRLSTNLSSGHIMLFIFSYFSVSSLFLCSIIYPFILLLFGLELCISLLQAYIFSSLMYLYVAETVYAFDFSCLITY